MRKLWSVLSLSLLIVGKFSVAHNNPLASHFSHRKTEMRIRDQVYWPGMGADIRDYCRSCDKCQGRLEPVPLKPIVYNNGPIFTCNYWSCWSFNSIIIRSLLHTNINCFAIGFPEALPLKGIDSISVAESLLVIFSTVVIRKEILSDHGTEVPFKLWQELFTIPYHPSCNGRIERLCSTLKSRLRKVCLDKLRVA